MEPFEGNSIVEQKHLRDVGQFIIPNQKLIFGVILVIHATPIKFLSLENAAVLFNAALTRDLENSQHAIEVIAFDMKKLGKLSVLASKSIAWITMLRCMSAPARLFIFTILARCSVSKRSKSCNVINNWTFPKHHNNSDNRLSLSGFSIY